MYTDILIPMAGSDRAGRSSSTKATAKCQPDHHYEGHLRKECRKECDRGLFP